MRNKDSIIIKYLIENENEELNILKISKGMHMDYKNVYSIVNRLEKESLIKIESFGQSNRVKLIKQVHPLIFEAEYRRREEILKDKNLMVMLNHFKTSLKTKCYILLLFGSYAKKIRTKHSDIDLMFICSNGMEEQFEKDVDKAARLLPLPLHCSVFSDKQFLDMINSKEFNVGQEALRNNIILYGIETYYEMI